MQQKALEKLYQNCVLERNYIQKAYIIENEMEEGRPIKRFCNNPHGRGIRTPGKMWGQRRKYYI